jgi:hypothetical protein
LPNGFDVCGLYGQYFIGILRIYLPVPGANGFVQKGRNGSNAATAFDIGFECEGLHDSVIDFMTDNATSYTGLKPRASDQCTARGFSPVQLVIMSITQTPPTSFPNQCTEL